MKPLWKSLPLLAVLLFTVVQADGSERRTKYGCEGSSLEIECEAGEEINLVRANYGRFSISICNKEGNTAWSVNCMEPRTLRVINKQCRQQSRCTVAVSSALFGDPCPGTSKYVEVHYTCIPGQTPTPATTPKPRPPWLLDLSATPSPSWTPRTMSTTTTAQTTTTTTIPPTTETTTTTTTVQPTTRKTRKPGTSTSISSVTEAASSTRKELEIREDLGGVNLALLEDHCQPVRARGLLWNWTSVNEAAIQPCPGGTTGFARWHCGQDGLWLLPTPDLSECRAHWVTRLETRLRNGEAAVGVAADLAAVTETRGLYGGDLLVTAQLLQGLAHRLRQDLATVGNVEQRETLVTELLQHVQKTGSHLLTEVQDAAWSDLRPAQRAAAGTNLVLGIEENAFLVADTVETERNLVEVTENILSSVRVMSSREVAGQTFPSRTTLHLADEATLHLPAETVRQQGVNGAVRLVFFLYDKMERVLPSSTNGVKFLNSRVVSAGVSTGRVGELLSPMRVALRHQRLEGVSRPSCVRWEVSGRVWGEDGCEVDESNSTHTTCLCRQFGNIAVLMAEGEEEMEEVGNVAGRQAGSDENLPTVLGAAVAVLVTLILTVAGVCLARRLQIKSGLHKFLATGRLDACLSCKEGKGSLYPGINSSPTSTTLSSGTPTTSTTMSSNYFLHSDCQVREPVVLSPITSSSHATIYRTTLANGQSAHVIPVSQLTAAGNVPGNHYFRPVSPLGHIYMEIDPVYAKLDAAQQHQHDPQSDPQLSDVSDDDVRRSSDISRQSSSRYAEERPLIRNTVGRRSREEQARQCQTLVARDRGVVDPRMPQGPLRTVSGTCGVGSLRGVSHRGPVYRGQQGHNCRLDTPITIALSSGGDQFVSLNLDQQQQQPQRQQSSFQ